MDTPTQQLAFASEIQMYLLHLALRDPYLQRSLGLSLLDCKDLPQPLPQVSLFRLVFLWQQICEA